MTRISFLYGLIGVLLLASPSLCRRSNLIELDEQSWDQLLTGEWMVQFYAPWCPACKSLKPNWEEFSKWSDDLSIKVASIDVTTNPGLSGRFIITALPTIFHVKDGVFRQYSGSRDTNTFSSFIEEKKWEKIEPVPSWKAPNSIQMSILSYFFKISMVLRSVHNRLIDDYGIPNWGSYVLFALAIILVGVLLGLMIVCCIDFLFPARETGYVQLASPKEKDNQKAKDSDDDILADDTPLAEKKEL